MANEYVYNTTFEDHREEEDRECINDCYRAKTSYYESATAINEIILDVLEHMTDEEIKEVIKPNFINPVIRRL